MMHGQKNMSLFIIIIIIIIISYIDYPREWFDIPLCLFHTSPTYALCYLYLYVVLFLLWATWLFIK